MKNSFYEEDSELFNQIKLESERQQHTLCMIPSENYASPAVRTACGSVLMNKYSEGYPRKRYYQGNEYVDAIETIAVERAKQLFQAQHANVQPLSGSPANQAVFFALLKPGDTIMGMDLSSGGHLTHGSHVSFSGKLFRSVQYKVNKNTGLLDMAEIRALAIKEQPKLIISGLTAYPRSIDFRAFQEIATEVGAVHLADISHIAGLIAAGVIENPVPYVDFVMFTTHKTLRGPRGAVVLCKQQYAEAIDKAIFPGLQGGPHDNMTAAKAVCFKEAMTPQFKAYARQTLLNAKKLAAILMQEGIILATSGTDNHLMLLDLQQFGIGLGKKAAVALERAGICVNANTIPYEPSSPFKPSGIRLGTPALATRGMQEKEMALIGVWIADIIKNMDDDRLIDEVRKKVEALCAQFPIPNGTAY